MLSKNINLNDCPTIVHGQHNLKAGQLVRIAYKSFITISRGVRTMHLQWGSKRPTSMLLRLSN